MNYCNKPVFMIGGKIGSGKDTLAKFFMKWYNFKRFAFADELKSYVAKKYNFEEYLCHTQEGKRKFIDAEGEMKTIREILIKEGTDKRNLDINFWSSKLLQKILNDEENFDAVVISDFRYPNEYEYIKSNCRKVITIKVERPGIVALNDPSEKQLDSFNFDYIIQNTDSLEEFEKKCKSIINKF